MQDAPLSTPSEDQGEMAGSRRSLWLALGVLATLVIVLVVGKFGGFFEPEELGSQLGVTIRAFADGPFGVPALILAFCVCAYIAMPQFLLIGVAIYAFGPGWGAFYAWLATMVSGAVTYWVGRFSGQAVLAQVSSSRLDAFRGFVARNAFVASAVVRNVTAGPFVFVNTVFGSLRVSFIAYMAGMGLGIIPKIALIAFAGKGIVAALNGNELLAAMMALAAIAVLAGGWLYVRHRRRKGENIALSGAETVDSAPPEQH